MSGTRIRFVYIPPDSAEFFAHGAKRINEAFAQIGDAKASTDNADSSHLFMHCNETVDMASSLMVYDLGAG